MMRAVLIVIGIVALAVMELRTPPRSVDAAKAVPDRFQQLTIGRNLTSDASEEGERRKGDRLDIARAHDGPPAQQILFAERLPQPDVKPQPAVKSAIPQKAARKAVRTETKTVERSKRVAHDNKATITKPNPKPTHATERTIGSPDRSKAASEMKSSCKPNAFGRLLQTLNLSPGCET